ncbi:hypothetical protein SHELI_v1c00790 [Spiroplasma helicoides]|uniref:Folate family ECF transporter S component n=1 Tax=Spiroplasma helicoides TaxID=216938 RepID=A0A1B3SJC3_9MOLU|nr:folate family ECF transporter S component [Spiroplasma helicoides]AOG60034.1 hypothetical protein SHELI_v1c00790 [Spiroplasma helicoides]
MIWYISTNVIGLVLVLGMLILAFALEGFTFKKISIKHITIMATFGAVSVALTNFVGYSIPIFGNVRLAFGDWIIFLLGMCFGPLCGVISGISIDSIGNVIPNSFGYHAGYMLNKAVLGFFGALVFLIKSEKRLFLKVALLYSIPYVLQSLVLNQIWMYSWKGDLVWLDMIAKLIKLPIALPIYISVTYFSFRVVKKLLDRWQNEYIWCFRNQQNQELALIN